VGKKEPSYMLGKMVISIISLENSMEAPQKLKLELPYDPVIWLWLIGIYPKEFKLGYSKDTCPPIFMEALFTIAKLSKVPHNWLMD
jgi:hypothetical protein